MKIFGPLIFTLSAFIVVAQDNGLTVRTRQGDVAGMLSTPTVRQWLGIPYAVANRWERPRTPPSRPEIFKATSFGDSCVQLLDANNLEFLSLVGLGQVPESEDCLTTNIWAPSVRRKQKTAVMLWIYGGGFVFGTSNTPTYVGQNIVRDNDDVLVVTFNYRLNIFGQPNAPQLVSRTQSQNFGLLDLDAIIQWVHDNIAAFGGDPERIILFGQSAGSAAADLFTFANPKNTIIKGVIEQSGSVSGQSSSSPTNRTAFSDAAWNTVSSAVGCGNATNAAQLECMKVVPFRKLEDAVVSTGATFGTVVDNITVLQNIGDRSAAGDFLHIPLLLGSTAQEGDIFVITSEEVSLGFTIPTLTQVISDVSTLAMFTCPAAKAASDRVKAGVPTWRYQYQGIFPDTSSRSDLRAYHASEIPLVFGTYNSSTSPFPPTAVEIALSRYIQGAWVAFARDPVNGLTQFGWPAYNPNTESLVQLGNLFNQSGAVFEQPAELDSACGDVANVLLAAVTQLNGLLGNGLGSLVSGVL